MPTAGCGAGWQDLRVDVAWYLELERLAGVQVAKGNAGRCRVRLGGRVGGGLSQRCAGPPIDPTYRVAVRIYGFVAALKLLFLGSLWRMTPRAQRGSCPACTRSRGCDIAGGATVAARRIIGKGEPLAPIVQAEAEAAVREEFERLEAEVRARPGVADFLDVFERHDAVLEQVRIYLAAENVPPVYSTTDSSNGELG